MATYYEVLATIDGDKDVLFGSFVRRDCVEEIEAERRGWKEQGYRSIKIVSRETTDIPDKDLYKGEIVTAHELFLAQAPAFNFELDEEELLIEALERGYVTKMDGLENAYLINPDY